MHDVGLKDLYALLEVSPDASQEVIQAAYHVLARTWHPDVNASPQAAGRIRELNHAYEVLGDTQQRASYDLERARARRRERSIAWRDRPASTSAARSGGRVTMLAAPTATPVRAPILSPQALLAIAAIIALVTATLFIMFAWVVMSDEPALMDQGPSVELRDGAAIFEVRPK